MSFIYSDSLDTPTDLDNSRTETFQRISDFWSNIYNRFDANADNETDTEIEEWENEDEEEKEEEEDEDEDGTIGVMITDDDTITQPRSASEFYQLTAMNNTELFNDLVTIVHNLRQINQMHRMLYCISPDSTTASLIDPDGGIVEDAAKLVDQELADLETSLSTEHEHQSTLALIALLIYQDHNSNDGLLQHFLDANGEYNPTLAMFAVATYEYEGQRQQPKCCRDIVNAAEGLYGPNWLEEFHKEKESVLSSMIDKLSFVTKIKLKVRDMNDNMNNEVIR